MKITAGDLSLTVGTYGLGRSRCCFNYLTRHPYGGNGGAKSAVFWGRIPCKPWPEPGADSRRVLLSRRVFTSPIFLRHDSLELR